MLPADVILTNRLITVQRSRTAARLCNYTDIYGKIQYESNIELADRYLLCVCAPFSLPHSLV